MTQNNPMMQQMLNNPQVLQTMFNPQMLQGMAQMPAIPDAPANAPAAPNPMLNPDMMQQMMLAMQGGMGNGLNGGVAPPNPADTRPPEERFATQVQQLENMGFPDKHSNLQALAQTNGDVNQAINCLLGA